MEPTWGPSGADRTQVGPMLAPWTLLSGRLSTWQKFRQTCSRYIFRVKNYFFMRLICNKCGGMKRFQGFCSSTIKILWIILISHRDYLKMILMEGMRSVIESMSIGYWRLCNHAHGKFIPPPCGKKGTCRGVWYQIATHWTWYKTRRRCTKRWIIYGIHKAKGLIMKHFP